MNGHNHRSRVEPDGTSEQHPGPTGRLRRLIRKRRLLAVGLMVPALGLGVGLAGCGGSSSSSAATTTSAASTSAASSAGPPAGGSHKFTGDPRSGGGSGARSTNAVGGSVGTVTGVSASSFTVSTPTGAKVTVKHSSSTVYDKGTKKSTVSAVTEGATVLVIGKVDSTTISASQVIVGPSINVKKASANTIAFKQPNSSESKTTGTIPSSYKQGTGTIVSGTPATKATEASLSSYAGGVVDRVVRLSNGDYEVHNIATNWPHHVFETNNFKVIGAND
jgi:Domain of unknown function (DUF5666)